MAVHIGAGAVAVKAGVVVALVMDTGTVAHPPGMFLVVALAAHTSDNLAGKAEVADRVDMSAEVAGF